MNHEQIAMETGRADLRSSLKRWNATPFAVIGPWMRLSAGIAVALLIATAAVSLAYPARPHTFAPLITGHPVHDVLKICARNLLVLALHALICMAGYLAMVSVPLAADQYTGITRQLHLAARPAALVFVTAATAGSFIMQALAIGSVAPTVADHYGVSVPELLVLLSPHAIPELTAMFLPLGAWIVLVRRRSWNELTAASVLTVAIAAPMIVIAALIEVYVTPILLDIV